VRAPLAPGVVAEVGVLERRLVPCGECVTLRKASGSLALDGERELELVEDDEVTVRLEREGPLVVDVDAAMREAASRGLLTSAGEA
jgi:hypothetical protein